MKLFDRWFLKQCKKAWDTANEENVIKPSSKIFKENTIDANGINMKLHVANGGYIVEFQRFDDRKDRYMNELHVINEGENFGERLSEIITLYVISNR
jgi:hypothetical protein